MDSSQTTSSFVALEKVVQIAGAQIFPGKDASEAIS
jgi:hypothetical protein